MQYGIAENLAKPMCYALLLGLAPMTGAAHAGGIERSPQSMALLFEPGTVLEFSLGAFAPDISGVGAGSAPSLLTPSPGIGSGDMAGDSVNFGLAVKRSLAPGWDAALIFDQPFGADVSYPVGTGYFAAGSTAELRANALTAALKYTSPEHLSLFGGLRVQTLEARATVPFVGAYSGVATRDTGVGYLAGIAYERPDIALRVALTYNSRIRHKLASTESVTIPGLGTIGTVTDTDVQTPQSLNLEAQTGIAPGTLLFGSVRWVEWSQFDVTPSLYATATGGGSLVRYDHNMITYTIGLGRQFTPVWGGAVSASYESADGGFASNLGPNDGFWTLGLGGTYTRDALKITAGLRYVDIGGADTTVGGGATAARFGGNSGVAVGAKIAYRY